MSRLTPWLILLGACAQPAELPPEYPPLEAVDTAAEPDVAGDAAAATAAPTDAGVILPADGGVAPPAGDAARPAAPAPADAG